MKRLIVAALLTAVGCASLPPKEKSTKPALAEVPAVPKASAAVVNGYALADLKAGVCPSKMDEAASLKDLVKAAASCTSRSQWTLVEDYGNRMAIRFSSDPWGAYFLSLASEHAEDWPRARWMAELAAKKSPNEGICLYQLGRVQWHMGEMHVAFETLKKSVEKNPSLVEANILAGQLALLNDSNSEALRYFQHAVEYGPKHFEAQMGLAEAAMRKNDWLSADQHLRAAIELHPRDTGARITWAQGLETLAKDNSAALESYRAIQRLDHEHKLDAPLSIDVGAKIQILQVNVAEELKKKLSSRTPSGDGKEVSK